MELEDRPLTLIELLEWLRGESDLEDRLRAGQRLRGPALRRVIDNEDRRGFRDDVLPAESGYAEFQQFLALLIEQVRGAGDCGEWVFKGLAPGSPTYPQIDAGYIRHSEIHLLRNIVGSYRAVEVTRARAATMEEQCNRAMRSLMLADPEQLLTKPRVLEIMEERLPGASVTDLVDAWKRLTKREFPHYQKRGPRRKRN